MAARDGNGQKPFARPHIELPLGALISGHRLPGIGLIQRPALDEVFQLPLTPHGEVPLSPITSLEERRAHDATGTAITVSYLVASGTTRAEDLTGVIALAVPFPGIDGMAQAVIDAGIDGVAQGDSPPGKTGSAGRPADPA